MHAFVHECDTKHATCAKHDASEPLLPTRVLDLEDLPVCDLVNTTSSDWKGQFRGKTVRLVQTEDDQRGRYLALSYCWGSALPCKTTSKNMQDYISGRCMDDLPRTLQDSIMVARLLGLRYIWIDCLCK